MDGEPTFDYGMSADEFDDVSTDSPFVTIPDKGDGIERAGDNVMLAIETGAAEWKATGVSLLIPVTVIEVGNNYDKVIEIFSGVSKEASSILKTLAKNLGVLDKVFVNIDGRIELDLNGFAGARGKGKFVRKMSNQDNLRSTLESTDIFPLNADAALPETPESEDEATDTPPF